jgi:hypothetical protein
LEKEKERMRNFEMKPVLVFMSIVSISIVLFSSGCMDREEEMMTSKEGEKEKIKSTAPLITTIQESLSSNCDMMKEVNEKDACLLKEAYGRFDEKFCNKINREDVKWRCYRAVAQRINDLEICDKIGDEREKGYCYSKIAKDLSTCDLIKDVTQKGVCVSKLAKELEECDKIKEGVIWRDDCYGRVASLKKDPEICEKIRDSVIRGMCLENLQGSK